MCAPSWPPAPGRHKPRSRRGGVDPGPAGRPDSLSERRLHDHPRLRRRGEVMTKTPPVNAIEPIAPPSIPPLASDLHAGLRRLKLAAVRRTAPHPKYRSPPDATLDTRGSTTHAGRNQAGRRLQRRRQTRGRGVPRAQDVGVLRRGRLLDPAEGVRLAVES